MNRIEIRGIELAMENAGAGMHGLPLAGVNDFAVAHAIAVLELPGEHVSEDFHVAVRMGAEPAGRRHAVIVDNPQGVKVMVLRIDVVAEGKRVPAVEPVEPRCAAIGSFADREHVKHPERPPETIGGIQGYPGRRAALLTPPMPEP